MCIDFKISTIYKIKSNQSQVQCCHKDANNYPNNSLYTRYASISDYIFANEIDLLSYLLLLYMKTGWNHELEYVTYINIHIYNLHIRAQHIPHRETSIHFCAMNIVTKKLPEKQYICDDETNVLLYVSDDQEWSIWRSVVSLLQIPCLTTYLLTSCSTYLLTIAESGSGRSKQWVASGKRKLNAGRLRKMQLLRVTLKRWRTPNQVVNALADGHSGLAARVRNVAVMEYAAMASTAISMPVLLVWIGVVPCMLGWVSSLAWLWTAYHCEQCTCSQLQLGCTFSFYENVISFSTCKKSK